MTTRYRKGVVGVGAGLAAFGLLSGRHAIMYFALGMLVWVLIREATDT